MTATNSSEAIRKKSPKALIGLLVFMVLLIGAVAGTPLAIKHLVRNWLLENGGEHVRVANVDFNPFTAVLVFEDTDVAIAEQSVMHFERIMVDLAWGPLWERHVSIQSVTLSGLDLVVDMAGDQITVGSVAIPRAEGAAAQESPGTVPGEVAAEWFYGVDDLTLNDARVRLRDPAYEIELEIDGLRLLNFATWTPERPTEVSFSGRINGADAELKAEIVPLADQSSYQAEILLDELGLTPFAALLPEGLDLKSGTISYAGEIKMMQSDDGLEADHDGRIVLEHFDFTSASPALTLRHRALALDGSAAIRLQGGDAAPPPDFEGRFDLDIGEVAILAADDTVVSEITEITGRGIDIDSAGNVGVTRLRIAGLSAGAAPSQDPILKAGEIAVLSLNATPESATAKSVTAAGMVMLLQRSADGTWRHDKFIEVLTALSSPSDTVESSTIDASAEPGDPVTAADQTDESSPPPTQQPAFALQIENVLIADAATLRFSDESVDPAFEQKFIFTDLAIYPLTTDLDDQDSQIVVKGNAGDYGAFAIDGILKSFDPDLILDVDISAIDVPAISGYTRPSLGVDMLAGSLDTTAHVETAAGNVEGVVDLALHQLEIKTVPAENALQDQLPIPLGVALDTLRNRHNTIDLKIPISGQVDDPSFNINDALSKALASGVQKGALTYLTLALQPYGAMITVAKIAGDQLSKVSLNPVLFEPGVAELDAENEDYMTKIAEVLGNRPNVNVRVCGVAVPSDEAWLREKQAADETGAVEPPETGETAVPDPTDGAASVAALPDLSAELKALAKARADGVRAHLIDVHGVSASRLAACQARVVSSGSKQMPRTDLLI